MSGDTDEGAKTICPRELHAPPRASGAAHTVCSEPPAADTFFRYLS
jgi:hypothetical protein